MTDLGPGPHAKAPRDIRETWRRLKKNIFIAFFIDLLVIVATALVLSLLVKTFLIRSFFIPSGSMLETLQIQDRIIVNELVPDVVPIERGDVVVFKDPGNWLGTITQPEQNFFQATGEWFLSAFGFAAPDSSQHLVKRVIGVGGDHVICCDVDGKLTINGVAITEPYIGKDVEPSSVKFDVVVPKNSIWVMGDNRANSEDSRFHQELPSKGFVDKKFIVGRAFVVSWPSAHWQWLDNYPNVFKDVPKP
ncbi:MAG: signal peptidase I [Rhodoluna sp.]|nr:signal peptidase I [Rhodoluna sp.]MBP6186404.1 signal peptidase I [Rhodoluna sp.]